ncbi:substrate-binding domain-containing protein [Radiobacillus sp. PE A8.2]|uniref:substrate-binding domain-containing protein n=1 Tax=Radiobacillus sp. PE A8.2 TaxID=3380349 RepID=UPI00388E359C
MGIFLGRIKKVTIFFVMVGICVALVACSSDNNASLDSSSNNSNTSGGNKEDIKIDHPPWYKEPSDRVKEVAKLPDLTGKTVSQGPNGSDPFPANELELTEEDISELKKGNYTAAISFHYLGNDWSTLQMRAIKDQMGEYGIEIIATTDAGFEDMQQITDIKSIAAKKPDILFSIPVNPSTTASAYKEIAEDGTKVIFMDQPAEGLEPGKDYVSVVSSDNTIAGMMQADFMHDAIGDNGEIAMLYYGPDFLVANQRYEGFIARAQEKYPDMKIVETQGFTDVMDTQGIAAGLLTKHPDLDGMDVNWDVPAMGVVAAARVKGIKREDFAVTHNFLGNEAALNMAQHGYIKGIGAQTPYQQGIAEAKVAALALLGKDTPVYIAVPPVGVTRDNLLESYNYIYGKDPAKEIIDALN